MLPDDVREAAERLQYHKDYRGDAKLVARYVLSQQAEGECEALTLLDAPVTEDWIRSIGGTFCGQFKIPSDDTATLVITAYGEHPWTYLQIDDEHCSSGGHTITLPHPQPRRDVLNLLSALGVPPAPGRGA
jgi:hypothetical protein